MPRPSAWVRVRMRVPARGNSRASLGSATRVTAVLVGVVLALAAAGTGVASAETRLQLPGSGQRRAAAIASWVTAAAAVALDARASWQAPDRDRALVLQGVRLGVTASIVMTVKRLVPRTRPCAPDDCGPSGGTDSAAGSSTLRPRGGDDKGARDPGIERGELRPMGRGQLQKMGIACARCRGTPVRKLTGGLVVGEQDVPGAQGRHHARQRLRCLRDSHAASGSLDGDPHEAELRDRGGHQLRRPLPSRCANPRGGPLVIDVIGPAPRDQDADVQQVVHA